MRRIFGLLLALALTPLARAQSEDVVVSATLESQAGPTRVLVRFAIPAHYYVYADQITIVAEGVELTPLETPTAEAKHDEFLDADVGVYDHDVTFSLSPATVPAAGLALRVGYQACNDSICFRPMTESFILGGAEAAVATATDIAATAPPSDEHGWMQQLKGFEIGGTYAGYLTSDAFIDFLVNARAGTMKTDALRSALDRRGPWLVALLILLGGLALNLTPCVLPMIPINIAIIGAGAQAGSRARGFALGTAYGLGISLVYGVLGLVVILTGAKFGTLNASPWFNLGIAAIFVALALAMFDVFIIDLSRFQAKAGPASARKGGFFTALFLGGIAALLAGACVAPVLISVLLLSADLHARGVGAGLLLPFLLGVGMALPWPFAGAGLSFLPKPGKWMERVKMVFGVVIILFALWYGKLGVSLLISRSAGAREAVVAAQQEQVESGWLTALEPALTQASASGQPVFIDFWASWCKNCLKMEKTTFKASEVQAELEDFVRVKIQAEDISQPETKAMLDYFGAIGLPTYVVLLPSNENKSIKTDATEK
ncbi:MAG: thioredoxin family protein [Lentisphaerae bacterium]|nr:thioredoxin family protein [Lentisphaerota bacterium]